ncbi:hypothetical protein F5Y07DRAFT_404704 [Xylaria sp. FL0933]|nr:hypothetical protein F5Y07DRAFT_404704 [Xylaria sp. FL0933]
MMSQISRMLTKEEAERREKVFVAVEKAKPVMGREARQAVPEVEQRLVRSMLEEKKLPLVSSAYLNWRVDETLWRLGRDLADFPFRPAPRTYGVPYSALYAKAYFEAYPPEEEKKAKENKEAKEAKEAREAKGKGKEKEVATGTGEPETRQVKGNKYYGFVRPSTQVVDPLDTTSGEVVGFKIRFDGEQKVAHAPIASRVKVYQELVGKNMPYQEGCGPFQVECPFSALGLEFQACFGSGEKLDDVLMAAAKIMGGESLEVLVYAKYRDLPNGDRRVSLFLDWHEKVDEGNLCWRRTVYTAWCALLSLFNSQLQGIRMSLVDHVNKYYERQMREHLMLYSCIHATLHENRSREKARRESVEGMKEEKDRVEAEILLEKLERFSYEMGVRRVETDVSKRNSIKEKIDVLLDLTGSPEALYPIGEDPLVRLSVARPTAKKVLIEQVHSLLDPHLYLDLPTRLEQCMSLVQDKEKRHWEKLLPLEVRYNIVADAILDYVKDGVDYDGIDLIYRTLKILETCTKTADSEEANSGLGLDRMELDE